MPERESELSQPGIKPAEPSHTVLATMGEVLAKALSSNGLQHILLPSCLSSCRKLECPSTWTCLNLNDGTAKPWREQGRSCHCKAPFPSWYCWGALQNHTVPYAVTVLNTLQEPEQKARTGKFGFICCLFFFLSHLPNLSVPKPTLNIEGWSSTWGYKIFTPLYFHLCTKIQLLNSTYSPSCRKVSLTIWAGKPHGLQTSRSWRDVPCPQFSFLSLATFFFLHPETCGARLLRQ